MWWQKLLAGAAVFGLIIGFFILLGESAPYDPNDPSSPKRRKDDVP